MTPHIENITSFEFDRDEVIIDVRSPSEFNEDHAPGAINLPVLSDSEFERIGTIYKEVSPFEASKVGAALVAKNISKHLEEFFCDKPHTRKYVFYCARGGKRSRSMAQVCSMVGWSTGVVEGGYRAYRRQVMSGIEELSKGLKLVLIGGKTGTGKTALLDRLKRKGSSVLNLEELAIHRGSLLGAHKDHEQPAQKLFETKLFETLKNFSDGEIVFAEAESNKIGRLFIPVALWKKMKEAPIFIIENQCEHRVKYILGEYDPDFLKEAAIPNLLSFFEKKSSAVDTGKLRNFVEGKQWVEFVQDVLVSHYDPVYQHAMSKRTAPIIKRLEIDQPVGDSLDFVYSELIASCSTY